MTRIRHKGRPLTPEDLRTSTAPRHPWSAAVWEFSVALGRLAGLCVCLFLLILALGGTFHLREQFGALVPDWMASLLTAPLPEGESKALESTRKKIKEGLAEAGQRSTTSAPKRASFTTGSTKEEVLSIQGIPGSASEDVWRYGESEVRFSNGRVVNWVSSASNPLRVR